MAGVESSSFFYHPARLEVADKYVEVRREEESMVPTTKKRRRYGSYLGEISPAPDNLLNRDFSASKPNEK